MTTALTDAVAVVAACMAREIGDEAVSRERRRLEAQRTTKQEKRNDDDR